MGKSAKLHKRVSKTSSSSSQVPSPATKNVQQAKRKAVAQVKSKSKAKSKGNPKILGGADYVDVLLGGRRRAKGEASKMPIADL